MTVFENFGDRMRRSLRSWIGILAMCFIGLSLQVMAQQPANTYNVKTQGGAKGDGSTNDTVAIQNTLNAAHAAGKNVYFPAGTYIVSSSVSIPDNTSLLGDKSGISLVKSVQPYKTVNMLDDDGDAGLSIGNLSIQDLFFLNMRINFPNNAMSSVTMSRCVIATDRITSDGQGWMMSEWDGDDMVVEDCIFLSGHETGEWLGGRIKAIKASRTTRMLIRRNVIGLDMGNLSWLATEWQGCANWSDAVGRLNQFKTEQNLPRRMGEMSGGIAIFDGTENVIDQNIIHLDFDANLAGGMSEDHLIYSLHQTKIEITRNWLSGHPNTAGGGLKHRDTWGPGVIAANYLNDAPLILYSYGHPTDDPIDYEYPFDNQLIFRNYLKVTPQRVLSSTITGGSSRYGFNFMSDDGKTGKEIDVAENLFDLAANIQNQGINLAQGKTTADGWRIYESNFHVSGANSGELVEITGRNLTPGAYTYHTQQATPSAPYLSLMNADMAKYEAMEIPYLNIPPYGADPVTNNQPPVFTSNPIVKSAATTGTAYIRSIGTAATDANGDPLTFYKLSGPRWLVVANNGALIGTPTPADVGLNHFTVQVTDGSVSATATLQITVLSPGYADWLAAFPSISGSTPETDSEGDGMTNLMEYALGGNPIILDATTTLPKIETTPTGAQFTFRRSDASEIDTEMTFQYSYDLSTNTPWTDVAIGATSSGPDPNGVEIAVEESVSDADVIRITLPTGSEPRVFGRIRVTVTP